MISGWEQINWSKYSLAAGMKDVWKPELMGGHSSVLPYQRGQPLSCGKLSAPTCDLGLAPL